MVHKHDLRNLFSSAPCCRQEVPCNWREDAGRCAALMNALLLSWTPSAHSSKMRRGAVPKRAPAARYFSWQRGRPLLHSYGCCLALPLPLEVYRCGVRYWRPSCACTTSNDSPPHFPAVTFFSYWRMQVSPGSTPESSTLWPTIIRVDKRAHGDVAKEIFFLIFAMKKPIAFAEGQNRCTRAALSGLRICGAAAVSELVPTNGSAGSSSRGSLSSAHATFSSFSCLVIEQVEYTMTPPGLTMRHPASINSLWYAAAA